MNPWHHAERSAKLQGGRPEDYLALHEWFDATKIAMPQFRHRAIRHHSFGIFEAAKVFGPTILNSDGRPVPTRILGEQHCRDDHGRVPSLEDWLRCLRSEPWMNDARRS